MRLDFFSFGIKAFYPYRSNRCRHSFTIYDVSFDSVKRYIEGQGYRMDNHISWENESGLCFTYSDHNLHIGVAMLNERW